LEPWVGELVRHVGLYAPTGLNLLSIDSDLMGRIPAFNATLFLTALFGISASLATTFPMLCSALFFLGSALGVRHFFLSKGLLFYPHPNA
jgi:hypothetical protein